MVAFTSVHNLSLCRVINFVQGTSFYCLPMFFLSPLPPAHCAFLLCLTFCDSSSSIWICSLDHDPYHWITHCVSICPSLFFFFFFPPTELVNCSGDYTLRPENFDTSRCELSVLPQVMIYHKEVKISSTLVGH